MELLQVIGVVVGILSGCANIGIFIFSLLDRPPNETQSTDRKDQQKAATIGSSDGGDSKESIS